MVPALAVTVTVAWADEGRSPSEAALESLTEWAAARGLRLAPPRQAKPAVAPPDYSLTDVVEAELERARDAVTAEDATVADGALAKATTILRAHPELPAAAWLLAETLRVEAARWRRLAPRDASRSARAWARAAVLDGGRAPGVGESLVGDQSPHAQARVHARLVLDGADPADPLQVSLDGVPSGTDLVAPRGEHQLRLTRGGALVWAGWITLGDEDALHVALPLAEACSPPDLRRARLTHGAVTAPGVSCEDWVFASEVPGSAGELLVASCSGARCGPALRWKVGPVGPVVPEWGPRGPPGRRGRPGRSSGRAPSQSQG